MIRHVGDDNDKKVVDSRKDVPLRVEFLRLCIRIRVCSDAQLQPRLELGLDYVILSHTCRFEFS